MTFDRIKLIGQRLLALAESSLELDPRVRAIGELLEIVQELTGMLKTIREQTEETAPEVWEAVRKDYAEALEAFDKMEVKP